MEDYLGADDISDEYIQSKSKDEIILDYITMYRGIDAAHHKDWLLDQITRIVHDGVPDTKRATWENGHTELRLSFVSGSNKYWEWRSDLTKCDDSDCE